MEEYEPRTTTRKRENYQPLGTTVEAKNIPANGPFHAIWYHPGFNRIEMDNDKFRNESEKYRKYPGAPKEDEMYTLKPDTTTEWKIVEAENDEKINSQRYRHENSYSKNDQ